MEYFVHWVKTSGAIHLISNWSFDESQKEQIKFLPEVSRLFSHVLFPEICQEPGLSKVSHNSSAFLMKENIVRVEISVNDWLGQRMEVVHTLRDIQSYIELKYAEVRCHLERNNRFTFCLISMWHLCSWRTLNKEPPPMNSVTMANWLGSSRQAPNILITWGQFKLPNIIVLRSNMDMGIYLKWRPLCRTFPHLTSWISPGFCIFLPQQSFLYGPPWKPDQRTRSR